MNDIVINKIQNIQRCVRRAREEYQADRDGFATNYTRQDAALLNVLRACETAIDLANHVIRAHKLGIPVSSADSFKLLRTERIIDTRLAERLWCKDVNRVQADVEYDFVYVDQESFEEYKPASFRQLTDGFREYKEKM